MEKNATLDLGGIPHGVKLPAVPRVIDASAMSDDELASLLRGCIDEAESCPGISIRQVRDELL